MTNRERPTLVLVHGMWGTSDHWKTWAEIFKSVGWNVLAIDLPSHKTKNADVGKFGLGDYVEFVKNRIAAIDGRVVLIGHSMGGLIVQRVAWLLQKEGSEKIAGVVTVCSAPPAGVFVRKELLKRIWRYVPEVLFGKPLLPRKEDFQHLMLNALEGVQFEEALKGLVPESGRAARDIVLWAPATWIGRLACPVLVLAGSDDRLTPPEIQQEVSRKHGARLEVLSGRGHVPMIEDGALEGANFVIRWIASTEQQE